MAGRSRTASTSIAAPPIGRCPMRRSLPSSGIMSPWPSTTRWWIACRRQCWAWKLRRMQPRRCKRSRRPQPGDRAPAPSRSKPAEAMSSLMQKRSAEDKGQPLYVRLAQSLGDGIASGRYSVGTLLPTEAKLGQTFGVSRYTVRQAIQHLRHQGLVSARKGVGTRVEAQQRKSTYTHAFHSLAELLQYASETQLRVQHQ